MKITLLHLKSIVDKQEKKKPGKIEWLQAERERNNRRNFSNTIFFSSDLCVVFVNCFRYIVKLMF